MYGNHINGAMGTKDHISENLLSTATNVKGRQKSYSISSLQTTGFSHSYLDITQRPIESHTSISSSPGSVVSSPASRHFPLDSSNLFAFHSDSINCFGNINERGYAPERLRQNSVDSGLGLMRNLPLHPPSSIYSTSPVDMTKNGTPSQQFEVDENSSSFISNSVGNARKNSIEIFLSQSPSQALGSELMKLNLKENMSEHSEPSQELESEISKEREDDSVSELQQENERIYVNVPRNSSGEIPTMEKTRSPAFSETRSGYAKSPPPPLEFIDVWNSSVSTASTTSKISTPFSCDHFEATTPTNTNVDVFAPTDVKPSTQETSNHRICSSTDGLTYIPNTPSRNSFYSKLQISTGNSVTPYVSSSSKASPSMQQQRYCKYFMQGHCRLGSKCKFSHATPRLPNGADIDPLDAEQSFRNQALCYNGVVDQYGNSILPSPSHSNQLYSNYTNDMVSPNGNLRYFPETEEYNFIPSRYTEERNAAYTKSIDGLSMDSAYGNKSISHFPEYKPNEELSCYAMTPSRQQRLHRPNSTRANASCPNLHATTDPYAALYNSSTRGFQDPGKTPALYTTASGTVLHQRDSITRVRLHPAVLPSPLQGLSSPRDLRHRYLQSPSAVSQPICDPSPTVLSAEDIRGRIFLMSKDQNGCRLLQEQLEYDAPSCFNGIVCDNNELCDMIYEESLDHLAEMMVDPFGNYLFQKLLEKVNPMKRLIILKKIMNHLVAAALNLHGTRSVQKAVEICANTDILQEHLNASIATLTTLARSPTTVNETSSERVSLSSLIVEALNGDAVRLCIDSNGNHVIQRALQYMKPEYNQFVFDAVCRECTTVGTHRHGCCVLQRCLDAANPSQKRNIIYEVEKNIMKLMQDPYGNYVVQYVLDSCNVHEIMGVITKPLGFVYELSVQKFSSNVIEKCLEKGTPAIREKYIHEIIHCEKMNQMLSDQYANYVIQRAIGVCTEEQGIELVNAIKPHLLLIKNTSGGRRIISKIIKRFSFYNEMLLSNSQSLCLIVDTQSPNGSEDERIMESPRRDESMLYYNNHSLGNYTEEKKWDGFYHPPTWN